MSFHFIKVTFASLIIPSVCKIWASFLTSKAPSNQKKKCHQGHLLLLFSERHRVSYKDIAYQVTHPQRPSVVQAGLKPKLVAKKSVHQSQGSTLLEAALIKTITSVLYYISENQVQGNKIIVFLTNRCQDITF